MTPIRQMFVALATLLCGVLGPGVCHAVLIGHWRFEDGNFLADSSPNGHTLSNGGGARSRHV